MNTFILDNLSTAVILLDAQFKLHYMNTAAENLLDCSLQQTQGQAVDSLFAMNGNWLSEIQQALTHNAPFTRRQVSLQLASNFRHITVDYTVTPVTDNELTGFVLVEMQALDRLLSISREEALLSKEQTSRTLIRGLAHEIKNPLGGIRGAAQLLSRELKNPELQDYTRVIIDEADRLRNLVDRMLGINRPLQLQTLNVHEVLEHVAALAAVEVGQQVEVVRDYDPSLPNIRGDKEQLIQVVLNIVRNAIQAISALEEAPGSHRHRITLKTRAQHHFTIGQQQHRLVCRFDIVDDGCGIPAEIVENIFYPMISGRPEGTGLGLAIAQSIIIQHQGLIKCSSKPGETVFSIYLPLDKGLKADGLSTE